ncbi:DegV family protein [Paenibacillus turpanensis]|uniref:DegV family protein n=1 Tax=Paenibacillus turpanensis TaxID=2689078 RepID=UPI001408CDBA|nr:DegV family protein [Paenibacillus turpanensis]
MAKIKLFSDSTCDLGKELIEQHDIGIVPLHVIFGEESYKDGVDIDAPELYSKVDQTGSLPKTAAPSPGEFVEAFQPHIEKGETILYIGLSSDISATYQNARLAAQQFEEGQVYVVDSRNLATGIGILVLKAADLAEQGMAAEEIAATIEGLTCKVETSFIIDTLDYLYKGGRLSSLQNFIGSLLKIRPIVKVTDGKMILAEKIRGQREKALDKLLTSALADKDFIDRARMFVTHSMADREAELVREALHNAGITNVHITTTGCVISSHCGPQTLGIVYLKT